LLRKKKFEMSECHWSVRRNRPLRRWYLHQNHQRRTTSTSVAFAKWIAAVVTKMIFDLETALRNIAAMTAMNTFAASVLLKATVERDLGTVAAI
jgi:hypothetical protein